MKLHLHEKGLIIHVDTDTGRIIKLVLNEALGRDIPFRLKVDCLGRPLHLTAVGVANVTDANNA